jgi:pre-60S factor REI1
MESILSYLFAIVAVFHECLFCGSLRTNKLAVQDHMRGKGHCKVDFEDDKHELKQFYDFSRNLDDDGDDEDDDWGERAEG